MPVRGPVLASAGGQAKAIRCRQLTVCAYALQLGKSCGLQHASCVPVWAYAVPAVPPAAAAAATVCHLRSN